MSKEEKEFRKDHCRAGLYFDLRNALWLIGIEEVDKILQTAFKDEANSVNTK